MAIEFGSRKETFENFKVYETTLAGRPFKVEMGKMCGLSNASALIRYGETCVLCNVVMSPKPREGVDFFPLNVEYEEKLYAAGRIPGSFMRREGRPGERAILTSRVVDRPMRPLFPKEMRNDVCITMTVMSLDPDCSLEDIAGGGHFSQAGDLHRGGRTGGFDLNALIVAHGTHTANGGTSNQTVTLVQGAVLNQQGSNGALALIQAGFHNGTLGAAVGVGFQLHDLCFQDNAFQQILDACASSGRHGDAGSFAAPVFGHDLVLGQLFLHALRVSRRLIHLVDGNDQLDVGSLGVVDGLDGLGHDAVIGSNDQNRDIGHIRAAGTHGGKGFVARRIQEGNGAAVDIDLVSADGLGNAAGFACGNVSGTDAVQDGSFAVVNVGDDSHVTKFVILLHSSVSLW